MLWGRESEICLLTSVLFIPKLETAILRGKNGRNCSKYPQFEALVGRMVSFGNWLIKRSLEQLVSLGNIDAPDMVVTLLINNLGGPGGGAGAA
jgi:hypothetical protein